MAGEASQSLLELKMLPFPQQASTEELPTDLKLPSLPALSGPVVSVTLHLRWQ